jgi:hypothetical protein
MKRAELRLESCLQVLGCMENYPEIGRTIDLANEIFLEGRKDVCSI